MIELGRFWRLLDRVPAADDADPLYGRRTSAGRLRRANLERYLELMIMARPTTILVGEAPGYRGAAITGIPFMSVRELTARPGLITGDPEGDGFRVPPDPAAVGENTSAAVWRATGTWRPLPLSWPVCPHHPFPAGQPLGNRAPRSVEVAAGLPVVLALIEVFMINRVIAVGRKSEGALRDAGVPLIAVRHPSQGGAAIFARQLAEIGDAASADVSGRVVG